MGRRPQGGPAEDPGAATDPQGGQVLTQGPVHEAFAAPVVHDPKAGAGRCQGSRRTRSRSCRRTRSRRDRTSSGSRATGPGIRRAMTTCGSAASGASRRRAASGSPATGTRWTVVTSGSPARGCRRAAGRAKVRDSPGVGQGQATYMPPPPASLEAGPNTPQPSPNVAWTPGYWFWQGSGYAWRPGFWAAVQPNWIWMPPHYVWTPSGYLFVPGYWDLPVANRGLMFAPVYYPQPVYAQPGFAFTPSISIVGSAVTANLFVQASTNQYLFGNYYAQTNVSVGIVPVVLLQLLGRPPGVLRPAVLVLCGGQRAAEPAVDHAGPRGVCPAPRQHRAAAAGDVCRAGAGRAERHDHAGYHGGRPSDDGACRCTGWRPTRSPGGTCGWCG